MAKPKGSPKTGGRQKGTPNKTSAELRQAILSAFTTVGGVDYLVHVAREDVRTFCTLLGKVLPAEMSGPDGGPIPIGKIINTIIYPAEK